MKTIYKYKLTAPTQILELPAAAEVLRVGAQEATVGGVMWVLLDNDAPCRWLRKFRTFGTGEEIPDEPLVYIGTYQTEAGLVWHVFEEVS